MALSGDYHTHTTYSRHHHGKSSIEENIKSAVEKGLSQIAITDHGFNQKTFGVRRSDIPKVKQEIASASERYPIEILLGVEANIISSKGDIDIVDSDYENLDILLCGYHKIVKTQRKRDFFFILKNILSGFFHVTSRRQREINTNAYINALKKYDIDVLTHLNHGCKVDVAKVAKVAKETNTYIELNGKRLGMSDKEILTAYNEGVKFIINSDAHHAKNVGNCHRGLKAMLRLRIPESAVVNYNSLPTFKAEKRKKGKR